MKCILLIILPPPPDPVIAPQPPLLPRLPSARAGEPPRLPAPAPLDRPGVWAQAVGGRGGQVQERDTGDGVPPQVCR